MDVKPSFIKKVRHHLEAGKTRVCRRLTKTTWSQQKFKFWIFDEISKSRKFITALERKLTFIDLVKHNEFLTNIIQGTF